MCALERQRDPEPLVELDHDELLLAGGDPPDAVRAVHNHVTDRKVHVGSVLT